MSSYVFDWKSVSRSFNVLSHPVSYLCDRLYVSTLYHMCVGSTTIRLCYVGCEPCHAVYRLPVWYHSEYEYSGYERPRGASE